jgi:hypothetical protein
MMALYSTGLVNPAPSDVVAPSLQATDQPSPELLT